MTVWFPEVHPGDGGEGARGKERGRGGKGRGRRVEGREEVEGWIDQ